MKPIFPNNHLRDGSRLKAKVSPKEGHLKISLRTVPVLFLDRDGVINEYPGDSEYVKSWEEFRFLPGAKESLGKLTDKGFRIFIVSNQAGVSKGIYSQESLDTITRNMLKELSDNQVKISGVYYCTHREQDNCTCRKPKTGLLDKAMAKLKEEGLEPELKKSYFIGDTIRDIDTGKAAGLKTILVFSGKEKAENKDTWPVVADHTFRDISEATDFILKDQ